MAHDPQTGVLFPAFATLKDALLFNQRGIFTTVAPSAYGAERQSC